MNLALYLNEQFSLTQNLEFFLRILIACFCGGCIGIERSRRFKEAGIRTHVIVCCAAALMIMVSKYGFADLTNAVGTNFNGTRGADPARIAAQVVSGVSFLGAGVIFKNGNTIKGLTTAAGIWATAGIGLAIGSGMYILGVFTTVVILLLQKFMHKFNVGSDNTRTTEIDFSVDNYKEFKGMFNEFINTKNIQVIEFKIDTSKMNKAQYHMSLRMPKNFSVEELQDFISKYAWVDSISSSLSD